MDPPLARFVACWSQTQYRTQQILLALFHRSCRGMGRYIHLIYLNNDAYLNSMNRFPFPRRRLSSRHPLRNWKSELLWWHLLCRFSSSGYVGFLHIAYLHLLCDLRCGLSKGFKDISFSMESFPRYVVARSMVHDHRHNESLLGKRYNVLRNRTDSWEYDLDQLLFGTILFTLLAFLFPTVLVYYALFAVVMKHP